MSPASRVLLETEIAEAPIFMLLEGDRHHFDIDPAHYRLGRSTNKTGEAHMMDNGAIPCTPNVVAFSDTELQVAGSDVHRSLENDVAQMSNQSPSQLAECRWHQFQSGERTPRIPTLNPMPQDLGQLPCGFTACEPGAQSSMMFCSESQMWSADAWRSFWTADDLVNDAHLFSSSETGRSALYSSASGRISNQMVWHTEDDCDANNPAEDDTAVLRELIASDVAAFLEESGDKGHNKAK
jgi:hypothetical protein